MAAYAAKSTKSRRYWALETDPEHLAAEMRKRCKAHFDYLQQVGRIALWRRCEALYYGEDADSAASAHYVAEAGREGESLQIRANHFRSIIGHSLTLATGTRPAITAKAENSDYRTAANRKLAESIVQHHMARGDLEDALIRAAEYAHTHGEGYVVQLWDELSGELIDVREQVTAESAPVLAAYQNESRRYVDEMAAYEASLVVDPLTGQPAANDNAAPRAPEMPLIETEKRGVYEGDITYYVPHPADVIRDVQAHAERPRWYIVRKRVNRWDLAARYPESEDLILDARDTEDYDDIGLSRQEHTDDCDDHVTLYELFHGATPHLPNGRRACMVGGQVIPESIADLGYRQLPVHAMVPAYQGTRPVGYGMAFDLVSLSKAYDAGLSTVLTNYDALATVNVYVPDGGDLEIQNQSGVRVFSGPVKPDALDLMRGIDGSEQFLQLFRRELELVSGINSVARGEPDQLKAGVALAFMQAMAIQATSAIQRTYARLVEMVGTALIHVYRVKATRERVVEIAGSKHASKTLSFIGDDLEGVNTISVDLGNPMMRSMAGRIEVAEKLLSHPTQPITPRQFLSVLATGREDEITDPIAEVNALIELENERLRSGGPEDQVIALPTDDARLHVPKHLAILNDPEARLDPALIQRVMAHVREHQMHAQQIQLADTTLAELAGLMPLQTAPVGGAMAAPPPMPPGPPPGPQGPGPRQNGPQPPEPRPAPMPGVPGATPRPNMPDLPPGVQLPPDVAAQARNAGMPIV